MSNTPVIDLRGYIAVKAHAHRERIGAALADAAGISADEWATARAAAIGRGGIVSGATSHGLASAYRGIMSEVTTLQQTLDRHGLVIMDKATVRAFMEGLNDGGEGESAVRAVRDCGASGENPRDQPSSGA